MSYSNTIKSRWREQYDRHTVGALAHDHISRTLQSLETLETRRAQLVGDVHLSERGVAAQMAKTAAAEAKTVEQARRVLAMGRDAVRGQRLAIIPKPADKSSVEDGYPPSPDAKPDWLDRPACVDPPKKSGEPAPLPSPKLPNDLGETVPSCEKSPGTSSPVCIN